MTSFLGGRCPAGTLGDVVTVKLPILYMGETEEPGDPDLLIEWEGLSEWLWGSHIHSPGKSIGMICRRFNPGLRGQEWAAPALTWESV
jgi:hypothetical protein